MNVTGPGSSSGLTGVDARALRLLAETLIEGAAREPLRADDPRPPAPADRVSVSVDALTTAPLQHLLQTIEQRLFPLATAPQEVSAPPLADAKDTALKSVDKAAQAIQQGVIHNPRIPENLDPQTVLALATRMIETQQYPNYLRATELSNTIVTWYEGRLPDMPIARSIAVEPVRHVRRTPSEPRPWTRAIKQGWRRAPVLVLLIGWLVAGIIIANISAKAWALGFPALVALQFILTIRGAFRRRK